jgi:hypothetical protein
LYHVGKIKNAVERGQKQVGGAQINQKIIRDGPHPAMRCGEK